VVLEGREEVATGVEVIGDRTEGTEELLGVLGRFEPLEHPLSPAGGPVAVRSDAALGQQLLHVPVPQQEAVVQQHGVTDALAWEPVALVPRRWLMHHRVLRLSADHTQAS